MRYLMLLFIFIYGCANTVTDKAPEVGIIDVQPEETEKDSHLGCQEGEVKIDGTCTVAENNNAMLFGQDFTGKVVTHELADGFLAKPTAPGNYPGVIMIHEWWGLNDNIREMARILANEGYVVYAVDLYDGQVATTSDQARELSTSVRNNPDAAIAKMKGAVAYLKNAEGVDKVASLGWCFGGGQSLQLSMNEAIDATVVYYGSLSEDREQLANIRGPVLGIFGSEDQSIPVQSVRAFAASLDSLGKRNEVVVYDGVGHAFANPSGSNYAAKETLDAWKKTVEFLDKNLPVEEEPKVDEPKEVAPIIKVFQMDAQ
jgi:carboxymethylenebutenolidase